MDENDVELGGVDTLHLANTLCTEDYQSDKDKVDYNIMHAGCEEGNRILPDLADENDNLLLNETNIPEIEEYLSFFFSENNQYDNEIEETPLYVNGKSVVRGRETNHRFICSLCDKSFALKQHLEYHMVIHTGDKAFICGICKKRFAHRHHLTQHMLTHVDKSTVPMHRCTICGRGFLQGYNLTRHLRVHTGERRFPCFICNKFFTNAWALQNHLMIHTDDRPFTCEICSRGFRKKCHLQRHLRTHANKRKRRKRSMVNHQQGIKHRNQTNDRVTRGSLSDGSVRKDGKIICINCDETFSSQMKFKNHDCAYVAPRYCTRQVQKRKETLTIDDSESDEDIHDDNGDDEDYIVSDDDNVTGDDGGEEEEDSDNYDEDCYEDDADVDEDDDDGENCDDDDVVVGYDGDDDVIVVDDYDEEEDEQKTDSESFVDEYGIDDLDNNEDDADSESFCDDDGDDYDDFADEINDAVENRADSLQIKIE